MRITWEGIFKTLLIIAIYLFLYFYQARTNIGQYQTNDGGRILDTRTGDTYDLSGNVQQHGQYIYVKWASIKK